MRRLGLGASSNPSGDQSLYQLAPVLASQCLQLIELLKAVDICGRSLYEGPALQHALWRYEKLWLPLLAALAHRNKRAENAETRGNDSKRAIDPETEERIQYVQEILEENDHIADSFEVIPPLDVAWVWYIHRLSGSQYLEDVASVVGLYLAPDGTTSFRYGTDGEGAGGQLWQTAYALQDLSDVVDTSYFPAYLEQIVDKKGRVRNRHVRLGGLSTLSFASLIQHDIPLTVARHRGVLSTAIRNAAISKNYISQTAKRYTRFLQLRATSQGAELYMPEDIDIVLRVHIASTADYLEAEHLVRFPKDSGERTVGPRYLEFAHPDTKPGQLYATPSDEVEQRMNDTEALWNQKFGTKHGPYTLPATTPRQNRASGRDGYMQLLMARHLEGHGSESESDSDADSDVQPPSSHNSFFALDLAQGRSHAVSTDTSATGFRSPRSLGRLSQRWRGQVSSPRPKPPDHGESKIRSHKAIFSGIRAIGSPRSPGTKERSQFREARDDAPSDELRWTSLVVRLPVHGEQSSSYGEVEDTVAVFTSSLQRLRNQKSAINMEFPAEVRGMDEPMALQSPRARAKIRKEERKRVAEQKEFEHEMKRSGHAHGLGTGESLRGADRLQLFRGIALMLMGLSLLAVSVYVLNHSEDLGPSGIHFFVAGMGGVLLAALVLSLPDSEQRKAEKEERKQRREQKAVDAKEKQEAKARKKKANAAIHIYTFSTSEPAVSVVGCETTTYEVDQASVLHSVEVKS